MQFFQATDLCLQVNFLIIITFFILKNLYKFTSAYNDNNRNTIDIYIVLFMCSV